MSDLLNSVSHLLFRVQNGSGVLVSPSSKGYSYILTAKHNLEADEDGDVYLLAHEIKVTAQDGAILIIADYLIHPDLDLAILVTDKELNSTILISKDIKDGSTASVVGYPEIRDGELGQDQLREFPGTVARTTLEFTVVSLDDIPDHTQLIGVSGGGLFKERENDFILCGIQSRIEGDPSREHHGRVRCIPIGYVEKLLNSKINNKGYSLIFPDHFSCFSKVQPRIFLFDAVQTASSILFLKGVLHSIATDLLAKNLPKPQDIYQRFHSLLLVNNSAEEDVFHPLLWITYLEFLILASIIDKTSVVNFSYLEQEQSKRRFLFSATSKNWTSLLRDIYTSDLTGLSKDGVIIVSTQDKSSSAHALTKVTLSGVIADIGRMQPGAMRIDRPMTNAALEFRLYHWAGLHHQCVISKEDDYSVFFAGNPGAGYMELLEKIRDEYHAFI